MTKKAANKNKLFMDRLKLFHHHKRKHLKSHKGQGTLWTEASSFHLWQFAQMYLTTLLILTSINFKKTRKSLKRMKRMSISLSNSVKARKWTTKWQISLASICLTMGIWTEKSLTLKTNKTKKEDWLTSAQKLAPILNSLTLLDVWEISNKKELLLIKPFRLRIKGLLLLRSKSSSKSRQNKSRSKSKESLKHKFKIF